MDEIWYIAPSGHVLDAHRVSSLSSDGNPFNPRTDPVACTRLKKFKRALRTNQPREKVELKRAGSVSLTKNDKKENAKQFPWSIATYVPKDNTMR